MILENCLEIIESRLGDEHFLRPDYGKYCFSQIPSLVETLLGTRTGEHPLADIVLKHVNPNPRNVVLFMIDGFGYNQWLRYAEQYSFMRKVTQRGNLMPITALFPSTTSASVTTISSGLTPQEHGLIEWHLYLEELDEIITTLPFMSMKKGARPDELAERRVDPHILFDGVSLHARLRGNGVYSHVVQSNAYAHSAYSRVSQVGSNIISFNNSADMMVLLRKQLAASQGKSYFYAYWDGIDAMSHQYGPHSEMYLAELNGFMHMLRTEFLDKVDRNIADDTVVLVTADHGHAPMYPERTIYLNDFPEVDDALAVSPAGNIIQPWGSPRDVFLKVKDDRVDEMFDSLSNRLEGRAAVFRSQEEADKGLFGAGKEHSQFRKRIGNILILPYEHETVWYQHPGLEKSCKRGMHGGLSREEMLTGLGFATLCDLI